MRKLLGLMGLMGIMGILSIMPINSIQAQSPADSTALSFRVNGYLFFWDNEYFGRRIEGYTLPGFHLTPKLIWSNGKHLTLEGGVSWLHYWGAHSYPNTMSYGVLPDYSDTSTWMHVVPWLQAKLQIAKGLELTLGSINPSENHLLPQPLRNIEREIAADPECGLMLDAWNDWGKANLWIDWREFIWNQSPRQERFTMGLSGKIFLDLPTTDFSISLPAHFIAQHVGGQVLAQTTPIQNNFNAATGLGITNNYPVFNCYFDLSCRVMWYHQHGNAGVPFSQGWGIYPELQMEFNESWLLLASYWHGKDFVPLLGSWHFSNLSANSAGLTFDCTRVATLSVGWKWYPLPSCGLTLKGILYHYLPSTGTFADGTTQEYGHRNQFSVGVTFSFIPIVRLY